jgi:hypothetical protein
MKSSFKKSTSLAIHSKNPDKSLFKSRLYKRFTTEEQKENLFIDHQSQTKQYMKKRMNIIGEIILAT